MVGMFDWKQDPHRRFNPLTREWVLVSPHRTARGPGRARSRGRGAGARSRSTIPPATSAPATRAPAACAIRLTLRRSSSTTISPRSSPTPPLERFEQDGLLIAEAEPGVCRVVCFSPRHDLTVANMEPADLRRVVDMWSEQFSELGACPLMNYVQIFENRGAMMGASNPHPHCQIWSNHAIPNEVAKETGGAGRVAPEIAAPACCATMCGLKQSARDRIVDENDHFVTVVPFWAVWPFETMVLPKRHMTAIDATQRPASATALADILKRTTARYDRLFQVSFPYSYGLPPAPHRRRRRTTSGTCTLHFYPAAATLRDRPQIPGRLRDAGHPAARHHPGIRRRPPPRRITAQSRASNFAALAKHSLPALPFCEIRLPCYLRRASLTQCLGLTPKIGVYRRSSAAT